MFAGSVICHEAWPRSQFHGSKRSTMISVVRWTGQMRAKRATQKKARSFKSS
jgi:hypothetical protein